jgi:hypothetical protein
MAEWALAQLDDPKFALYQSQYHNTRLTRLIRLSAEEGEVE